MGLIDSLAGITPGAVPQNFSMEWIGDGSDTFLDRDYLSSIPAWKVNEIHGSNTIPGGDYFLSK